MKKNYLLRLFAALLLCALAFSVVSCANNPSDEYPDDGDNNVEEETVRIIKTELINGNLIVTYSDGTVENLGPLSGESDSDSLSFYPLPDGTYGITAGNTIYLEGIAVPETYKGRTVTQILSNAFSGLTNLKSISLPKTIVSIGEGAFQGCENLETLNIPESVKDIGASAFYGCKKISGITIGDEIETIGSQAFYMCESVDEIILPDHVFSIGGSAFYGTKFYANEENWRDNILYIGNHLIAAKSTVGGNYAVKDGTVSIANLAFGQCKSLTGITVPDSVVLMGAYVFMGCEMLQGINLGSESKLAYIGTGAFSKCISLREITLPEKLISIEAEVFSGCKKIEKIVVKNDTAVIKGIGERAFYDCDALTEIIVPDSVAFIGVSAFEECDNLAVVTINKESSKLEKVGGKAFYGLKKLGSITLPATVSEVGDEAFAECVALREIIFGSAENDWKWNVTKGDDWNKNIPCEKITFTEKVTEETK